MAVVASVLLLRQRGDAAGFRAGRASIGARRIRASRAGRSASCFAFSGWAGALVYVGALLVETYDLSIAATGLALGFGALVYVPGNFLFRRWVDRTAVACSSASRCPPPSPSRCSDAFRPSVWVSVGLFATLCFIAGGRTLAAARAASVWRPSCVSG